MVELRTDEAKQCFRTSPIVFGLWMTLAVVPLAFGAVRTAFIAPAWDVILLGCTTSGIVLVWLGSYELCIRQNVMCYRSLLNRRRCISKETIGTSENRIGYASSCERFRPFVRTEIRDRSGRLLVAINRKPFSKTCINQLDEWLASSDP
jgi:hypothetical protein